MSSELPAKFKSVGYLFLAICPEAAFTNAEMETQPTYGWRESLQEHFPHERSASDHTSIDLFTKDYSERKWCSSYSHYADVFERVRPNIDLGGVITFQNVSRDLFDSRWIPQKRRQAIDLLNAMINSFYGANSFYSANFDKPIS